MSDLISRQAAIDALQQLMATWFNDSKDEQLEIEELINTLPSAQPERKTGRWEAFYHGGTSFTYRCSACGIGCALSKTNYCPTCGARMGPPQPLTDDHISKGQEFTDYICNIIENVYKKR